MKKVSLIVAALSLTACVSTTDAFEKPPTQVLHSTRSAEDVALCLSNKYAGSATVYQARNDGSHVFLLKNAMTNGLGFGATIVPEGQGSRIDFRKGQYGVEFVTGCAGLK